MRYFRQSRFVLLCLIVAFAGYEVSGSGFLGRLFTPAWLPHSVQTVATAVTRTATEPPRVVRLTPPELEERDQWLSAAFGQTIPATLHLADVPGIRLRNLHACLGDRRSLERGTLLANPACDLLPTDLPGAHRLLTESDPKVETLFWPEKASLTGRVAFFLGKDQKAKILVWFGHWWGDFSVISVKAGRRATFLEPATDYWSGFLGDDPGPGETSALLLEAYIKNQHGLPRKIGSVDIDAHLAQRFRYYAALKNKPYYPKEWINQGPRTPDGCAPP